MTPYIGPFLTAYDPSDLPGGSIDPLGFDRGYYALAEKILPGLTNVADKPRYYGVLCAGALLADVGGELPTRQRYRQRLQRVLRFERLWALANVMIGDMDARGIRGVTYAQNHLQRLQEKGASKTDGEFRLLGRQVQYGAVGIYGAINQKLMFWDRRTLDLTPDSGLKLAEAFLEETGAPRAVRTATRDGGELSLSALEEWGQRAHVATGTGEVEARCLRDAARLDRVRFRMLRFLQEHPYLEEEDELDRIGRIKQVLDKTDEDQDLREACQAILAFERAYAWALLGFERVLYLCRTVPGGVVGAGMMGGDEVLQAVHASMPGAVHELGKALQGQSEGFRRGLEALSDSFRFLEMASAAQGVSGLLDVILARHRDVQHGKFDQGRRKMPWVEERPGGISLTLTRVGGMSDEPLSVDQITPHFYRLEAADALIEAARGI